MEGEELRGGSWPRAQDGTWLGARPSGLEALAAICLAKKSSFAAADASS